MKLIQYSSLWGNMYRHRYYKNGTRITEAAYNDALASMRKDLDEGKTHIYSDHENGTSWYRITHTEKVI